MFASYFNGEIWTKLTLRITYFLLESTQKASSKFFAHGEQTTEQSRL